MPRILVADDSQTIQKVVKITLSQEKIELYQALNEDELFEQIEQVHFNIVLLDFNLSESLSGYQLCKKMKKIAPHTHCIMMFGTFDTINENEFQQYEVSDFIVKPFDGQKFLRLCQQYLKDQDDNIASRESTRVSTSPEKRKMVDDDSLDHWEITGNGDSRASLDERDSLEHMTVMEKPLPKKMPSFDKIPLESLIINEKQEEESTGDLPLEIPLLNNKMDKTDPAVFYTLGDDLEREVEQESTENKNQKYFREEYQMPADDDLEYPQVEEIKKEKPQFVPMDQLNIIDDDDQSSVMNDQSKVTSPSFELPEEIRPMKKAGPSLTDQIMDEISGEKFWEKESRKESTLSSWEKPQVQSKNSSEALLDVDELIDDMVKKFGQGVMNSLKPTIEKLIREECYKAIESVAKNILPHVAEQVIKEEVREISQKVLRDASGKL
jgi:DNA-binding response OmpR family regulator